MATKLKWQFGGALEALNKEVDKIVGPYSLEELLNKLPSEIEYDETQSAKLVLTKHSDTVWQVAYMIYLDPKFKRFEKVSIKSVTEPSLKLALFEMLEELNKPHKKQKSEDEEEEEQ